MITKIAIFLLNALFPLNNAESGTLLSRCDGFLFGYEASVQWSAWASESFHVHRLIHRTWNRAGFQ